MGNLKEKYLKLSRIHLETRRGTVQEAADYCKKEGNYWEEGESIGQGKRSDIESACAILRESGSIKRVADECESVFVKYHKGLTAWKDCMGLNIKRDFKTKVIVLIGEPGTGKARLASDIAKYVYQDKSYYKPRGEWWDGFQEDTECVVIVIHCKTTNFFNYYM